MRKQIILSLLLFITTISFAQNRMTRNYFGNWERVSALGISKDGKYIVYSVGIPDVSENKTKRTSYIIPIEGGQPVVINDPDSLLTDKNIFSGWQILA